MKSYFDFNRVAKQYSNSGLLFESDSMDNLIKSLSDQTIEIFKKVVFDIAPDKERTASKLTKKLSEVSDSSSGYALFSKILDFCEDADVKDGKFSESKELYIKSLKSFVEASKILKNASSSADKKLLDFSKNTLNRLATAVKELSEDISSVNENYSFINESILSGYNGRVRKLREKVNDLITSAEGKNSSTGYSRDWKKIFIELSQKIKALDTSRGGSGTKDKEKLNQLEKDLERYQKDFNNNLISSAQRNIEKIESGSEDVSIDLGDVVSLMIKAMEDLTRANTAHATAEDDIKEEMEEREERFTEALFPIKRGDRDSDSKFGDSGIIEKIQKSLMNGNTVIKRFLSQRGGSDGIFGPAMQSVISTLQKQSGNNDINGEIDKSFFERVIISDFISSEDRKKIQDALDVLRKEMISESRLIKEIQDFYVSLMEAEKIRLDQESIASDLDNYYKEYKPSSSPSESSDEPEEKEKSYVGLADEISKKLRSRGEKVEADKFLRDDGTIKKKYSPDFLKAWNYALGKSSDDEGMFFFNGGLYALEEEWTSLYNPINYEKWKESVGDDEQKDYIKNYSNLFSSIGYIDREKASEVIDLYLDSDSVKESVLKTVQKRMKPIVGGLKIPYIDFEKIESLKSLLEILCQNNEAQRGNRDMGREDFVGIVNVLTMVAGTFTFDNGKFISVTDWIRREVLDNDTISALNNDRYFGGELGFDEAHILYLTEDKSINGGIAIGNPPNMAGKISWGEKYATPLVRSAFSRTLVYLFGNKIPTDGKFISSSQSLIGSKKNENYPSMMTKHLLIMDCKNYLDYETIDFGVKAINVEESDLEDS